MGSSRTMSESQRLWVAALAAIVLLTVLSPSAPMHAAAGTCSRVGAVRTIGGAAHVCVLVGKKRIWVPKTSSRTTTTTAKPTTTTTTQKSGTPTIKPGLPRSTVDRPGNREWDVKFIYATFKDGIDERRDVNGSIAGIAADVNRYFGTQHPGHRARYDLFEGQLDVQHIEIPMTNKAFYDQLFVDDPGILEDFFQSLLNGAGLEWKHGLRENVFGKNRRYYFMFVEGYRGKKFGDMGVSYDYECTGWDNPWSGLTIRFLRRLDGRDCPGQVGYWVPATDDSGRIPPGFEEMCDKGRGMCRPWGWTLLYALIQFMMLPNGRDECDYVVREIIATPTPNRPYVTNPESDIWNTGSFWQYPIGHPKLATFDPLRNRYFKMDNGPYVGEKCRDIQYSPMWERISG